MQNYAVKAVLVSLLSIMLVSVAANADLCVLKNPGSAAPSTYDPGGILSSKYSLKAIPTTGTAAAVAAGTETATPCTTADGNADLNVDLTFSQGDDIVLDVVYEQKTGAANQFRGAYFYDVMYYAGANDGNKMTPTIRGAATSPCNNDPGLFFKSVTVFGDPNPCASGTPQAGTANVAVVSTGINGFGGDLFPADPANFVLDRVTFANTFTTTDGAGGDGVNVYTVDFERDDVGHTIVAPTDVGVTLADTSVCYILSDNDNNCATNAVTKQNIMTAKLSVTVPPCFIGPPTTVNAATCVGDATACAADSSSTKGAVSFTYTVPSACYLSAACDTPSTSGACAGFTAANAAVVIKDSTGAEGAQEFDGSYSETINNTSVVPINFDVRGVGKTGGAQAACNSSSACTPAAQQKKTASLAASCSCGARPTISITNAAQLTATYVKGSDIKLDFTIADTDKTGAFSADITEIKVYYRNIDSDATVAQEVSVSSSTISSTGKVTITIDKAFVEEDISVFFGIVIKDVQNLTGTYPSNFSVDTGAKTFTKATAAEIPGANIIGATSFAFTTMPYPNQFPFVAAEDANNMLQILFGLNATAQVSMRIYTLDGRLVRQIDDSTNPIGACVDGVDCNRCNDGSGCQWDGTDFRGGRSVVGNGMYIVNIHAVATGELFTGASIDYTKGIVVMK